MPIEPVADVMIAILIISGLFLNHRLPELLDELWEDQMPGPVDEASSDDE